MNIHDLNIYDLTTPAIQSLSLSDLARAAYNDWPVARSERHPAGAYLVPMLSLSSLDSSYGSESGRNIVSYFLSNAGSWRGDSARAIKAELRRRLIRS